MEGEIASAGDYTSFASLIGGAASAQRTTVHRANALLEDYVKEAWERNSMLFASMVASGEELGCDLEKAREQAGTFLGNAHRHIPIMSFSESESITTATQLV